MAIQNRRGQAVDFVPSKMLPGEFAVSLDNRKLYMCFASGTVKEVALTDDVTQAISTASTSLGGRIAVLESASTEQGATLLTLVTRMGTAEAAIRSHDGRLVVLENDGTNIKARLSDVESETATLDELLTDLNLNMITISNDVEGLKSNAVRFDTVQNKSAAQKLQARENTDSAGIASLATAYSPSARYAVGDMVTYDGKLYTCKTAITTAEAWNSSHWTEVTVGDQLSNLKDDLSEICNVKIIESFSGGYINNSVGVGNIVTITPVSNTAFVNKVIECTEGDVITLNARGWTTGKLWSFLDADNKVLSVSGNNAIADNLKIIAPENTSKCIINSYKQYLGVCYFGVRAISIDDTLTISKDAADAKATGDALSGLELEIESTNSSITGLIADFESYESIKLINFNGGAYINTAVSAGNTVDLTPVPNTSFEYAIVDVTANTNITLNAMGWTTGRLWCFIDDTNKVLSASGQNVSAENLVINAPNNAAKCIINTYKDYKGTCFVGIKPIEVDTSLTTEGKAADAKATGDITKNLTEIYNGIVEGGVSSDGIISYNSTNTVRTEMIPVSFLGKFIKPVNYRAQAYLYDKNFNFLQQYNYVQTQQSIYDDLGSRYKELNQEYEYVIILFRHYVDGSTVDFTPTDYYSSGIELWQNNVEIGRYGEIIADGLNNVIIENEILTSDRYFTLKTGRNFYKNAIVSIDAISSGETPCTIQAQRKWLNSIGTADNQWFSSPKYVIGGNLRKRTQFRLPCGIYGMKDYDITISVPENSTLTIYSLSVDFDDQIYRDSRPQLNAHGLCGYGGPPNTAVSFVMSAKLGYKYCITIPKVTRDGIYVCFHDDANIQGSLRNPDGTTIATEYQDRPISDFTYSDLMAFDAGVLRGQIFKGEKIPLLEDFFKICAETGMHPMLSVHPDLSGHWENIKSLAVKYNVLDILNVKAPMGTTMTAPMSVFGNDIESYTVDINSVTDAVAYMNSLKQTYNLDESKVKLGIEYFLAYATDANINAALAAGYFVAVANITSDVYATYASFIEKGVTQFTDNYVPNTGLRWY